MSGQLGRPAPDVSVVSVDRGPRVEEGGRDWSDLRAEMVADENDLAEDLEILMARLRRERKRLGLTQQAVAQRMNVSQSRVSAIETGAVEATEVGTLARYVNALGVRLRLSAEFSK